MPVKPSLTVDRTITLAINGSTQHVRLCATRTGLPPLLIVQAGPGLPLLNEVAKFQQRLYLEQHFMVAYWEQRGCGAASREDAMSACFQQQVDDLRSVLRWLREETRQTAVVFAISLGATIALRAVEHEPGCVKSVVAVSVDTHTAWSDAAADAFLQAQSLRASHGRLRRRVTALEKPPYLDPGAIQRRARLLADLGTIERGKTFNALLREALFSMIRTYGVAGTVRALRNINIVQRTMLPELVPLDLLAAPPRSAVPVHCVFGEHDALLPAAVVKDLPAAIIAPACTVRVLPDAGHMVHFDQPEIVRSIAVNA